MLTALSLIDLFLQFCETHEKQNSVLLFHRRAAAAAEGCEPCVDGADAQQAPNAGGHLQSVSALQRQRPRGHQHSTSRFGGAGPEELAEPPGLVTLWRHKQRRSLTDLLLML